MSVPVPPAVRRLSDNRVTARRALEAIDRVLGYPHHPQHESDPVAALADRARNMAQALECFRNVPACTCGGVPLSPFRTYETPPTAGRDSSTGAGVCQADDDARLAGGRICLRWAFVLCLGASVVVVVLRALGLVH